jgi:hypothetical protein
MPVVSRGRGTQNLQLLVVGGHPSQALVFVCIQIVDVRTSTGEAQLIFGGVPHVPVEPPRCQHAAAWSGARHNDMYAFVWAILLRSASPYGLK